MRRERRLNLRRASPPWHSGSGRMGSKRRKGGGSESLPQGPRSASSAFVGISARRRDELQSAAEIPHQRVGCHLVYF